MEKFKTIIFSIVSLCSISFANANDSSQFHTPTKHISIGYDLTRLTQEGFPALDNYLGVSFTYNKSYYFVKPFKQRLKIGLDVAWVDLHYANYKVNFQTLEGATFKYNIHTADVGVQLGLGLNFNFTNDLSIHAKACYNPTLSGALQELHFGGAFAHYGVAGLTLTYKKIGIGVGVRFGNTTYHEYDIGLLDEEDSEAKTDIFTNRPGIITEEGVSHFKTFQFNASITYAF